MNIFKNQKDKVVNLKLDQVIPNNSQPRTIFDQEKITELSESIKEHGIIQPIIVRFKDGLYEIVAGERRYRACKDLGFDMIPAIVKEYNDSEVASVAVIENIQREDLTAIEEARAYKLLMEKQNMKQEELATKLGKAQSTIANKIRLLNLPINVQEAVLGKEVSERHARALLSVKDHELQTTILQTIIDKDLTVKETEQLIKKKLNKDTEQKKATIVQKIPKDVRIAMNTLNHAVSMITRTGLEVETNQREDDTSYTLEIKIPKSS
ncbi:nucleoid occlusion protein [Haloplasma contractile]|uniref:Nucleoid occlusion protein n=1 Tax=Haloplasma contractile SSD-17B TaxID=1033810 RepID=F7PT37_9MOLU|nr:nucleoid occlusion protein [Haloplasma contractile]ERJ12551.1 Nucleoid occlusion protein [Haloplasma contractile SSD-17B]